MLYLKHSHACRNICSQEHCAVYILKYKKVHLCTYNYFLLRKVNFFVRSNDIQVTAAICSAVNNVCASGGNFFSVHIKRVMYMSMLIIKDV